MSNSGSRTAASGLPSYVSGAQNLFDVGLCRYNWKAANTYHHRTGLANAIAGNIAEEVFIGDSATDGATSLSPVTFDRLHAWPLIYRAALGVRGIPIAGTGIIRVANNTAAYQDSRVVDAGTWTTFPCYQFSATLNSTLTISPELAGTACAVGIYGGAGGGTVTISVDGAVSGPGFTTVNTATLPSGVNLITLTGLANQVHVIVIKVTVAASGVIIYHAYTYTPGGGYLAHNVAQDGGQASGTGANSWSDTSNVNYPGVVWSAAGQYQATPYAVHCALGGNDIHAGQSPAQIAAGITTIRNYYPNSDFILHLQIQAGENTPAAQAAWCTAAYQLADTLNVPLIDWQNLLGSWNNLVALGLNGDSVAHLNRAGYAMIGNLVGKACIV